MRNLKSFAACILSVSLGLVSATPIARAQDMVIVAPKNCRVLLENDKVRVVRVILKPGEKLEMHSHPAYVSYSFTAHRTKSTSADGKTEERERKPGQTAWRDPETHSTENVGTTEGRVLVIELKK